MAMKPPSHFRLSCPVHDPEHSECEGIYVPTTYREGKKLPGADAIEVIMSLESDEKIREMLIEHVQKNHPSIEIVD